MLDILIAQRKILYNLNYPRTGADEGNDSGYENLFIF